MSKFKKVKYATISQKSNISKEKKLDIPSGLWVKCEMCGQLLYYKELQINFKVCHKCNYHFRLSSKERIDLLFDKNSFIEYDTNLLATNPLNFPKYEEKLIRDREKTGLSDAAVNGEAKIFGYPCMFSITDSRFLMGSMGSVVGEKITRNIERAIAKKLPLIISSGTGGGARMYEGMFSLMQMAKTSIALAKLHQANLLYISILTDPTMAGVLASFASLGDIIIAEPNALIGFTGPRVIEQTIKQTLPKGFQRSEFQLQHGMIDLIVERKDLKQKLATLLSFFVKEERLQ